MVEIAYGVVPSCEGRGYATEAARARIHFATGDPRVKRIRAHTRPEANASTRVLAKCGFVYVGPVVDPEDVRSGGGNETHSILERHERDFVMATGQAVFVPGEWRSLASCLGLSPRECGIVRAVFDGHSEKDTAARLGLSPHTVHTYLWRIYRKLSVQSRESCWCASSQNFVPFPNAAAPGASAPRADSARCSLIG